MTPRLFATMLTALVGLWGVGLFSVAHCGQPRWLVPRSWTRRQALVQTLLQSGVGFCVTAQQVALFELHWAVWGFSVAAVIAAALRATIALRTLRQARDRPTDSAIDGPSQWLTLR